MNKDKVVIYGGGTFVHHSCHLSLASASFGNTARYLASQNFLKLEPLIVLTKMADYESSIVTVEDLKSNVEAVILDSEVKAIIMTSAICDFSLNLESENVTRLDSSKTYKGELTTNGDKVLTKIKHIRPDITLVGFKTTKGETETRQIQLAQKQIKQSNVDFVFANDVYTRNNIIVSNSRRVYRGERNYLLEVLVKIVENPKTNFEAFKCYQSK